MRFRAVLPAILCACLWNPLASAKEAKWFEVSSDHFILFTDTNEMKGRRLVSDFENRIATFSEVFGKLPARQFPIEIFLFNEEPDFIEIMPRVQSAQAGPQRGGQPGAQPGAQPENQQRKNAY